MRILADNDQGLWLLKYNEYLGRGVPAGQMSTFRKMMWHATTDIGTSKLTAWSLAIPGRPVYWIALYHLADKSFLD